MINILSISEIEHYLSQENLNLDDGVQESINYHLQESVFAGNEDLANYNWCLQQIYIIQKGFIAAVKNIKNKKYEEAWNIFDKTDIMLGHLERNFDIMVENDRYFMMLIGRMIKEYQKLFPYRHFLSRECIITEEKCSICGKKISLRNPCGHKVGKLYMGKLCLREVVNSEIKAVCIVTDPFDKYTYVQLPNQEYNYGMLEAVINEIDRPYDEFRVETIKVIKPEYKKVGRNAMCPCGSGMKYKKCHLGTADELMDHYKTIFNKKSLRTKPGYIGTFQTWKL